MKKNLGILSMMLLLGSASINASAQTSIVPVDEDTKLITYKEVVTQEGDINKLYNTCIAWINANYKNAAEATTVRDPENGKIIIRHSFKIYNTDKDGLKTDAGVINYTLKLEFKPNKYRYVFTDFGLQAVSKYPLERWLDKKDQKYTPVWDVWLGEVNTWVNDWITSLKKGMVPKVAKPDNW